MARRQASNAPVGWRLTKVNGTRKAINPQGQIVAYNQYLNAQARQSGFRSHADYRKRAKVVNYFRNTYSQQREGTAKKDLALGSENLRLMMLALYGPNKDNMSPGGPMAQFLEAIGWRAQGASYSVGETP